MARASTPTWLPLDEFAQIIGINPLHFNGLSSTLFNNTVCGEIFFQYDWQNSDRIGRETIAMSIRQAEMEMAQEAGFNLMPDWITEERLTYPQPGQPGVLGLTGRNPRGMWKSVETKRGHVISGGVKTKTLVEAGAAVVRADNDGDGYAETATVTVAVTFTGVDEVHLYFNGKSGDDAYEIRPITVAISGGFATITFKSWQIPDVDYLERLDANPLDGDSAASYETVVDVYRVYNDPSTQVQFMWESDEFLNCCGTCTACQLSTMAGCFHIRDADIGIVVPAPASWDSDEEEFTSAEWDACREPDQVRLWYYSGYRDKSLTRSYSELASMWKYAIAYFAASKFERSVCGCSNVNQFIDKWRRDAAFVSREEGGFTVTPELLGNKLGTTMGALYAYKTIHRNGIRIIK